MCYICACTGYQVRYLEHMYFYQLLVDWALLSVDILMNDQRCLKISWRKYFSQVLKFWMGRFRTNISVFHLFLSGYMKALLLPKIITEIDVQWIEFFTRLSDWLACTLTNTYYMCMYKYILYDNYVYNSTLTGYTQSVLCTISAMSWSSRWERICSLETTCSLKVWVAV